MRQFIESYLEHKESSWALSTYRSEKSRLNAQAASLHLSPKELHKRLTEQGMKPYSIKTLFIRLSDLEKFAKLPASFAAYLESHKNRFKHVYQAEELTITYEQAQALIGQLAQPYRSMAEGMLQTGVRISEAYGVEDGRVVGKGGKPRKVFGIIKETAPKSTFALKLKEIGLKPHTLRKLCATRLADKGASAADLCKVFGWSDIRVAHKYLQAKADAKLQELFDGPFVEEKSERP